GAGQSGLQLGLGLLGAGHSVTLVSNRTAEQLLTGPVQSSQCMFESALATERAMGLDFWGPDCPAVEGIALTIPDPGGSPAIRWAARLDRPAQSVDQRVKLCGWMEELERRGGALEVREAGLGELEAMADAHELTIVATGRGPLGELFAIDEEKSPFRQPMRALALTYVRGMAPRPEYSAVSFSLVPGVGEYFVFPALTTTGPCEIMVFEGIPGGPMDCWEDVRTPPEHLARSLEILKRFFPWEHARCAAVELTDDQGILVGRFAPTVRRPVARLESGAPVLAMADAAVLNDPLTGQGANNAAKCAEIYLERILSQGGTAFDEEWMEQTFEHYWQAYASWVVSWTNAMLAPPMPHVMRLVDAAQTTPTLASTIVNGFDDPRTLFPWWMDAEAAEKLIAEKRAEQALGID
ncbi:MAG: styrene monooxygenase/indole monooxygenase family protein, partial [Solirubrobacteraceae bacterium]